MPLSDVLEWIEKKARTDRTAPAAQHTTPMHEYFGHDGDDDVVTLIICMLSISISLSLSLSLARR